jgi:hypothetical protein
MENAVAVFVVLTISMRFQHRRNLKHWKMQLK